MKRIACYWLIVLALLPLIGWAGLGDEKNAPKVLKSGDDHDWSTVVRAGVYDGDTPTAQRRRIRN